MLKWLIGCNCLYCQRTHALQVVYVHRTPYTVHRTSSCLANFAASSCTLSCLLAQSACNTRRRSSSNTRSCSSCWHSDIWCWLVDSTRWKLKLGRDTKCKKNGSVKSIRTQKKLLHPLQNHKGCFWSADLSSKASGLWWWPCPTVHNNYYVEGSLINTRPV